jgi:ABC-type uncharacterized transport system, permease component
LKTWKFKKLSEKYIHRLKGAYNLYFSKYVKIMNVGIQNELEYKFNFLARLFFSFIPTIVNIMVWFAVSNFSESNYGYSLKEMVSYYLIIFIVSNIIQCNIQWSVANDIKVGDVNKYLIKPINYIAHQFFLDFSKRVVYILVILIPSIIIGVFFKDYVVIYLSPINILLFIVSLLYGYIINFLLTFIISESSFYFSEVTSLFGSYNVIKNIVSGNVFPLSIVPKQIYQILVITPFQFVGYFPAMIIMNRLTEKEILNNIILGFVWIFFLFLISKLIWRRGLSKYSAFGG